MPSFRCCTTRSPPQDGEDAEDDGEQGPVGSISRMPEEELPGMVAEGLLLWRRLLAAWAVYRRWLEVRGGSDVGGCEERKYWPLYGIYFL